MRRYALVSAALLALGAPAAAWALTQGPNDGTLVVKDGSAPKGTPVVTLVITGAAIGRITGLGSIVIASNAEPEVTGFDWRKDLSDNATKWGGGTSIKFRAVGGTYTILIYGSDVDISAVGHGTVTLAGMPDQTLGDGTYSLNGDPFRSLPANPTGKLTIGTPSNG